MTIDPQTPADIAEQIVWQEVPVPASTWIWDRPAPIALAVDLSPEAGQRLLTGYLAHTDKEHAMTEEPTCRNLPCKCDECAYGCGDDARIGCKTCTYGCENRNCDCT